MLTDEQVAENAMPVLRWYASGKTGLSSEWLARLLLGLDGDDRGYVPLPLDGCDFGRCIALLEAAPGLREHLRRVPGVEPQWGPLVREWEDLERLWKAAGSQGDRDHVHERVSALGREGRATGSAT